jgi:hypothetical protein
MDGIPRNVICQFCQYKGHMKEWINGICPKCGNETKTEKYLKSIADSLEILARWCKGEWR